jgi:GH15 family glucan-1,4-alpha-glucosidase
MTKDNSANEFPLEKPVTCLGRSPENDIVLTGNNISKRHAKVILSKGLLEIQDLGSTNGTLVNGTPVDHKFLRSKDRIQIGDTEIVVETRAAEAGQRPQAVDTTACFSLANESRDFDFEALQSELQTHFDVIRSCAGTRTDGTNVLLATRPDSRYPFFYPRDGACAARLFRKCAISELSFGNNAFRLLEDMAFFLKEIQREDGYWGQRYSLSGEDEGIYKQEDNIAHAISTICNYILTAVETGRKVEDLHGYMEAINKGCLHALRHYYRGEIHLFYSTTSVHESALEEGFSCWVNFAYLYALTLVYRVCEKLDVHNLIADEVYDIRAPLQSNLLELLCENGRFIRRIDSGGQSDYRPDVTLMSPFYFGFNSGKIEALMDHTMDFVRRQLWDPELGLLQRYLPFTEDPNVHIHAGNGAWTNYSAILAQYYYHRGDHETGDMILDLINSFRNAAGEIPEHVSTVKRFREFMTNEWDRGIDFEKEFEKSILIPGTNFAQILQEAQKMYRAYLEVEERASHRDRSMAGEGYIQFCTPLMWSHVEYSKALLARSRQTFYARDHTQVIKRIEPGGDRRVSEGTKRGDVS